MVVQENFRRGQRVMVQCSGAKQVGVVVWDDHGDVVMVCGERQYVRLQGGLASPMPIGFRREDVRANTVQQQS